MGHWYTLDGKPCHFQDKKDGGTRATTLRDARKLNLVPSVTAIINIAAKPALTKWLIDQALLSALTLPKIEGETLDEFKARAERDSKEQVEKAMNLGSEIHADIERLYKGLSPLVHKDTAIATQNYVAELTGLSDGWVSEQSFSSDLGFGGMCDLHHPSGWVIDFKTKDFDNPKKRLAWDEQHMQLSAYAHGLGMPNARKLNIYISTRVEGLIAAHEWDGDAFDKFSCLLEYWQLSNNYRPSS